MLKKFLHWWKYGSPDPKPKPKTGHIIMRGTPEWDEEIRRMGTPIGLPDLQISLQEDRELFDVLVEFKLGEK